MSLNKVIAELPRLTFEERQILIRRALELDDPLSAADEALVRAVSLTITPTLFHQCRSMK